MQVNNVFVTKVDPRSLLKVNQRQTFLKIEDDFIYINLFLVINYVVKFSITSLLKKKLKAVPKHIPEPNPSFDFKHDDVFHPKKKQKH